MAWRHNGGKNRANDLNKIGKRTAGPDTRSQGFKRSDQTDKRARKADAAEDLKRLKKESDARRKSKGGGSALGGGGSRSSKTRVDRSGKSGLSGGGRGSSKPRGGGTRGKGKGWL